MSFGPITSLSITDSGFGYTTAPTVTIAAPDLDSGTATAVAVRLSDDHDIINRIDITDSGAYYVGIPTVTIGSPPGGQVTSASIVSTGVGHINGQVYTTTGGSGTGFEIRATSSGGLTSFTIHKAGKNYVVDDEVTTVTAYPATIRINAVGSGLTALAVAVLDSDAGGRVTSINLTGVGDGYDSDPSVTISAPDGTAEDFRATAVTTIDDSGRIDSLTITDSGAGYSTAPVVTIKQVTALAIEHNDPVEQTLDTGVKMQGEIVKYSDSDGKVYVAHVGADDGLYHNFVKDRQITLGPTGGTFSRVAKSVTELNKISENEQNTDFGSFGDDFLDFTESNPFGDPSGND
jgi:hypothetical protein